MKKLALATIFGIDLLVAGLTGCGKGIEDLPYELRSVNPLAREYLLAAINKESYPFDNYKKALDAVEDVELKNKIADFASDDFIKMAEKYNPFVRFPFVKAAIELKPVESKDELIDSSMYLVDRCEKNYPAKSADFLIFCAKYSSDQNKRTILLNRAADIYEFLSKDEWHIPPARLHEIKANYMAKAKSLRQGNFD